MSSRNIYIYCIHCAISITRKMQIQYNNVYWERWVVPVNKRSSPPPSFHLCTQSSKSLAFSGGQRLWNPATYGNDPRFFHAPSFSLISSSIIDSMCSKDIYPPCKRWKINVCFYIREYV